MLFLRPNPTSAASWYKNVFTTNYSTNCGKRAPQLYCRLPVVRVQLFVQSGGGTPAYQYELRQPMVLR
jgi:hypothetical protein